MGALWAVRRPRPPLDAELRHARLERGWFEPQDVSGASMTADAPYDPLEHGADVCALHVRESLVDGRGRRQQVAGRDLDSQRGARAEYHRSLDHVPELTDVTRPAIGTQRFQGPPRDALYALPHRVPELPH